MGDQVHQNQNLAPFPDELQEIVDSMAYRAGWKFLLGMVDRGQGSSGLTFTVVSVQPDTYNPDKIMRVRHYFPVPPAAYNRQSWLRWVLDRLIEIETHEACEFFVIRGEGPDQESRPFAPNHGPGWDPYQIRELNKTEDAETSFLGDRNVGSQE